MRNLRRLLISVAILAALAAGVRLSLPFLGRGLIRTDPLVKADAIVVLGSYRVERTLEAGALFREGWSKRIVLLRSPDVASSGVLQTLHIRIPVWIDIQKSALAQMAVPTSAIIESPHTQDTT